MQTKPTISLGHILFTAALVVVCILPFHAFLTVWLSHFFGYYTFLRLWKEFVLIGLVIGVAVLFARSLQLRQMLQRDRLLQIIVFYVVLQLIWGVVALLHHTVTREAAAYGLIVNLRPVVFFVIVWIAAMANGGGERRWLCFVLWPAAVVIAIGLLQYFVLPYDVLKHFGYNSTTIFPYETINNNLHYLRIMSTLRGANPLGAYLVLILSVGMSALMNGLPKGRERVVMIGIMASGVLVLLLTFSRAAWIGAVIALVLVAALSISASARKKLLLIVLAGIVVIGGTVLGGLRASPALQNALWHTETHSAVSATSNAGHVSAFQAGLHDALHEPLGRGPGTAGPASQYNRGYPVRIAENYYLQLAQEYGWLGLSFFLVITTLITYRLWLRRHQPLALGLLAALVGLTIVNCLSHAWTDDTLAYLWWGMAAVACTLPSKAVDEAAATQ